MADDHKATFEEFHDIINMTVGELGNQLGTEGSKKVGQKGGNGESTGHASGRRLVELPQSKKSALPTRTTGHVRKIVGYAGRRRAQRPSGEVSELACGSR